jgi:hypothetical protein
MHHSIANTYLVQLCAAMLTNTAAKGATAITAAATEHKCTVDYLYMYIIAYLCAIAEC